MKVLLVDGSLLDIISGKDRLFLSAIRKYLGIYNKSVIKFIDAKNGHTNAVKEFKSIDFSQYPIVVTNDIILWGNHENSWDYDRGASGAYVYDPTYGVIRSVDRMTSKEIRKEHNLEKMYLNGALQFEKPSEDEVMLSVLYNYLYDELGVTTDAEKHASKLSEILIENGIRYIETPGLVSCKGEAYICTPELEDKVSKLLNIG